MDRVAGVVAAKSAYNSIGEQWPLSCNPSR